MKSKIMIIDFICRILLAILFILIVIIVVNCLYKWDWKLFEYLLSFQFNELPNKLREILKTTVWLEWITFLVIFTALFREDIYKLFIKAKLEIKTTPGSELMHEVDDKDKKTDKLNEKQYWYGILIKNKGLVSAKNVEVYFMGLESNVINDFAIYNGIPLRRSWTHKTLIQHLPPNLSIRWDICYLHKKAKNKISFAFVKTPNALRKIPCKGVKKAHFKCKVIAKADNAKTKTAPLTIEFRGNYNKGFKIIDC